MRAPAVLLSVLAVGSRLAYADDAALRAVVLDVRLNASTTATTLVVQRDAGDGLWLAADDLSDLRLEEPSTAARVIDGVPHYPIAAFGDGATVQINDATQSAEIMLPPESFVPTHLGRTHSAVTATTEARPGGFFNYDVSLARDAGHEIRGGQFELGFFDRTGVVTSTFVAADGSRDRNVARLETAVTRDFPDRLARLTLGDSISTPGTWGQAARYAGLKLATNFATQPTLVTTPLLGTQGVATVPATVDVFVNGQRMTSETVPPGPFTIDRLPAINGVGELQVVVTDVLGRQQVVTQPYYSGPSLLQAGLDEFSFDLGSLREDFGVHSNQYRDFAGAVTWRRGITDEFTAEGHLELTSSGTFASGLDSAWRVKRLGIVSATAAASDAATGTGWLAGVGFERSGYRFSVFGRVRVTSDEFTLVGQENFELRPKLRAFLGGGLRLGRIGSVSAAYAVQSYWKSARVDTVSATWSLPVRDLGYLNLSAAVSRSDTGSSTDLLLLFTIPLGTEHTASFNLQHAPSRPGEALEATASLQKSRPFGAGLSYYSQLSSSGDYTLQSSVHGRAGVATVETAGRSGTEGWRVQGQGGIAFTAAGALPGRRLDQSFAVIETADYAGLTVYLENHPIGRTDDKGRLLIDRLRAYEPNRISLDPIEVPMDASLEAPAINVVPAWRSGPVVRFPIARAHAVTLRLVRVDGAPVPAGARISAGGTEAVVALDGLVYLEGAAGAMVGTARWAANSCKFKVTPPVPGDDPVPDLGTVSCDETPTSQGTR